MSIDINDITPLDQFTATSLQTVFNVTWTADATTDVKVYARATGAAASDITDLIDAADYTVTLVGGTLAVRVTFAVGRTLDDVVTITRDTPAIRDNLYINTNFTPSMLNGDFARSTMIEQQNEMYHTSVGPRYNLSETLAPTAGPDLGNVDRILPLLGASQAWVKNAGDTAIIATAFPAGGAAPKNGTYITQTSDAQLDNEQALGSLASGMLSSTTTTGVVASRVLTGTANAIDVANGDGSGAPTFSLSADIVHTGSATVDNLKLDGNTISSVDAAGDINLTPDTTGDLVLDGLKWPQSDGTLGQVLGTNGAGQVGYYDVVASASPSVDNTVVRYNGVSGAIQDSGITLSDADSLTGVTSIDTPVIVDSNGNEVVKLSATASAVNEITATNSATGDAVQLSASGDDTNIDVAIMPKGTGAVGIGTTTPGSKLQVAGVIRTTSGISFDSGSNTLSDYENGTWTPVISDASTGGNVSPGTGTSAYWYERIGDTVTVHATIVNISTVGMTAGNGVYIQSLPFTQVNTTNLNSKSTAFTSDIALGAATPFNTSQNANTSWLTFYEILSTGSNQMIVSDLTSSAADITFTITYKVA